MASTLLSWGSAVFDLVANISIQDQMLVTQHTLESGALVTDHARKMPASISCSVLYTDVGRDNGDGSADARYLDLLAAMESGAVRELLAGARLFRDCMLIAISRTWQRAEKAARLELTFQPVRFATGTLELIPQQHTRRQSAGKTQQGKIQPTATSAAGQQKASSLLNDLIYGD